MTKAKLNYQELKTRLGEAEGMLAALRRGEVDAIISHSAVLLLCVQEVETALEESEARYRALFDHSLDAILLTAIDGRILMSNAAAGRLFGWTADELSRMREDDLVDRTEPNTIATWAARISASQFQGELTYRRKDGSTFTGEMSSAAFGDPAEEKKNTVIIRDISERKRAEEALKKAQAELACVGQAVTMGELAVSIAHEINQPLGAIVNNTNVCLHLVDACSEPSDEALEALSDILSDAQRASAIIARVRALAERSRAEKTSIQIKEVIADVVALAGCTLAEHRVTVRAELAQNLPRVLGDRLQLQQVLVNLLMNGIEAIKGMADERRVITIGGKPETLDGGPGVLITVQDLGNGFKPEDSERLFDAFYTTKPDGLGLGLRIVRSIVEAHGGRLWATSHDSQGAIFSCALPAEHASD
jgi:PAS domain S-box-containing protein